MDDKFKKFILNADWTVHDPTKALTDQVQQINAVGRSSFDLMKQVSALYEPVSQLQRMNEHILGYNAFDHLNRIRNFQDSIGNNSINSSLIESMNKTFGTVPQIHSLAETALSGFDAFQKTFADSQLINISKNFGGLIGHYADLYSLAEETFKIPQLPVSLLDYPPIEMFYTSRLIERLYIEEPEEEEEWQILIPKGSFVKLLAEVNPDFIGLWRGSKQSIRSKNPDRARHTITSLRELTTHTIHVLAPDDKVENWTKDPEHYHNTRPTRRARMLYICRSIEQSALRDFADESINVTLELFETFQAGTHGVRSNLNANDLRLLRKKTESAIRFLIGISKLNSDN